MMYKPEFDKCFDDKGLACRCTEADRNYCGFKRKELNPSALGLFESSEKLKKFIRTYLS